MLGLVMVCALVIPVANVSAAEVWYISIEQPRGQHVFESGTSYTLKTAIREFGASGERDAAKGEVKYTSSNPYVARVSDDGTAMQDRLTYHPDGQHIIYFDEWGHEVFSDFVHVKRAIAGNSVDDYCFFNVYGYMYVNVLTYDKTGSYLHYANAYGVLERGGWFQFDPAVMWADGTPAYGIGGQYGEARSDGRLYTNISTSDWQGRWCYLQGNGVAVY